MTTSGRKQDGFVHQMGEFILKPVDIAGKVIDIGDTVAFCTAGKSSDMRIGKVIRITPKQVEILHSENVHTWDTTLKNYVYGLVDKKTLRHSNNVAKV